MVRARRARAFSELTGNGAVTEVAPRVDEAAAAPSHAAAARAHVAAAPVDVAAAPMDVAKTNRERVSRRQVDKFAERRAQLADAALLTLAELGYARTSLREIAQNSQFSHGVLHYYFSDKEDLLTHCVRQYEAACVTRYDEIVASASSAEELKREFSTAITALMVGWILQKMRTMPGRRKTTVRLEPGG